MRIASLLVIPVVAGLLALPTGASAQVSVRVSARLGPAVTLNAYSQQQYGDWRTDYRQWRPVTLYAYRGQYYQHSVRGARAVQVYQRGNDHFLPPQERGWVGHDRRYNNRHRPNSADYGRAQRHN